MKTNITRLIYSLGIVIALEACSSEQANKEQNTNSQAASLETAPSAGQRTVSDVVEGYLRLKDALVESNMDIAKERAVKLLEVIDATQMPHIQQSTKAIASADNLETQRVYFDSLSVDLYQRIQETRGNEQMLYKQFCPMAFNNRGAYWLSSSEEIRNPYFGEQMLNCGEVEEEIKPANPGDE